MADFLTLVAAVAIGGGLIWVAFRMEPHWSSKDGTSFICRLQPLTRDMANDGLNTEMRGRVVDGTLHLSARGLRGARHRGVYRVIARSPDAPAGKAIYLVSSEGRQMALRVPARSTCVAVLDSIVG